MTTVAAISPNTVIPNSGLSASNTRGSIIYQPPELQEQLNLQTLVSSLDTLAAKIIGKPITETSETTARQNIDKVMRSSIEIANINGLSVTVTGFNQKQVAALKMLLNTKFMQKYVQAYKNNGGDHIAFMNYSPQGSLGFGVTQPFNIRGENIGFIGFSDDAFINPAQLIGVMHNELSEVAFATQNMQLGNSDPITDKKIIAIAQSPEYQQLSLLGSKVLEDRLKILEKSTFEDIDTDILNILFHIVQSSNSPKEKQAEYLNKKLVELFKSTSLSLPYLLSKNEIEDIAKEHPDALDILKTAINQELSNIGYSTPLQTIQHKQELHFGFGDFAIVEPETETKFDIKTTPPSDPSDVDQNIRKLIEHLIDQQLRDSIKYLEQERHNIENRRA